MTHLLQFRPQITKFVSYLVPRHSRLSTINKMTFFGLSKFVQDMHDVFQEKFFKKDFEEIRAEVYNALGKGLGYKSERIEQTLDKLHQLWSLKYLPIEIKGLPEGTHVPMGVPAIEISTTNKNVPWVGQAIESWLSCEIWHPCISATVAFEYAKIAAKAYEETVDNGNYRNAFCDFSMRGQESYDSAVNSAAAWLTAFNNSSTVEAHNYIGKYYTDNRDVPVHGLTSTEHSVMTSDFFLCGSERETLKRLLTEIYPDISFAAVCDSFDFWRLVVDILPTLREEIENHEGFLGVRHDSAEPVEALCGKKVVYLDDEDEKLIFNSDNDESDALIDIASDLNLFEDEMGELYYRFKGKKYDKVVHFVPEYSNERGRYTDQKYYFIDSWDIISAEPTTWEDKGMVETLYELFGGATNSKGFKVINPKLKAVYGDSITIQRAKEIFKRLREKGFAADNVSLGVGSFSMEAIEENGELKPFTRDTFSIAIKATYAELDGGEREIKIFKSPKGFSAKKSIKGLAVPFYSNGELTYQDDLNRQQYENFPYESAMIDYYCEGEIGVLSFNGIRSRVDNDVQEEI